MYAKGNVCDGEMNGSGDAPYVIDLRSDTLTRPTQAMRDAMRNAVVGDDVYGEDPTVNELEMRSAKLLDKEAAIFVPTGTMGNLIAVMVHCDRRGCEMIEGDNSHTFLFEQGGTAQLANVHVATVRNKADGTFDLNELRSKIRINPDVHEPYTSLIVVENTHNMCGGKILPLSWLEDLKNIAKVQNISVHMDGARLFNAVVGSGANVDEIVKHCDSVCFCLSKGLGAPVGSVLAGTADFIQKARRMRKVLGGGMRQAGVLAAAGLVALDKMIDRLADDHSRAYAIAKAVADHNSPIFHVDLPNCQTNILMIDMDPTRVKASVFMERMRIITQQEKEDSCNVVVKLCSRNESWVRVTLYNEISDADVKLAIQKLLYVMKEFEHSFV